MMKATLFKEVNYSLSKLVEDIDMGEIGLPNIQRPFVWSTKISKVRDLFDSMYKGYPVGYLLFWANNGGQQIGTNNKQEAPRLLIVDGQQRLTALYAVLKGKPVLKTDYTPIMIQIAFCPKNSEFKVSDSAIARDNEFIQDISQLWALPRNRVVKDFLAKLRSKREVSDDEEDKIHESIDRLYELHSYPFTALTLSSSVDEEHVAEIFVRINSQGVTLRQADFILTLMSVFWDKGRSDLELFCREARKPSMSDASPFNYFIQPDPDQLLRVSVGLGFRRAVLKHIYSILRGKDLETEQFSDERRTEQFKVLKESQAYVLDIQNWAEFMKVLIRAGYRSNSMITSKIGLMYCYTMFLIGKRDYKIDHFVLRNLIARWFFTTSLTGRYTGSPESTMEADLARLRTIETGKEFIEMLDNIIRDTLTEDFWNITLPNDLATSAARSPSLFAYHASLNLLDAIVLFSNLKISELLDPSLKAKKSHLERHHLFAKNYLKKDHTVDLKDINQIANFAFVEWQDNIDISDASPAEYAPEYLDRLKEKRDMMYYWHALPENWEKIDYQTFLTQRQKLIARVIRDGFQKLII